MLSKTPLALFVTLGVCLTGISCQTTLSHARPQVSSDALMQIVRSYSPSKPAGTASTPSKSTTATQTPAANLETDLEYESPIRQAYSQDNFDQLEKTVHEARDGKGRAVGGTWKVVLFYEAIQKTFVRSDSGESDWKMQFDSLHKWIAAKPESAAARISLAEAYLDYAWVARGSGYADTVSGRGWELYSERTGLAADTLVEAARLKEKCPYWYETMQEVALAQGWRKEQARELMELAVAYEPDYYHFYREHANFLQTKWYGEEGEVEEFAAEMADRVGGPKGDILYFELTSLVACQCDAQNNAMQSMLWPRIKQGYAALEKQYGVSSLKRNRFASMAVKAGDREAAREALAEIGPDWNHDVWVSDERFASAKNWAMSE